MLIRWSLQKGFVMLLLTLRQQLIPLHLIELNSVFLFFFLVRQFRPAPQVLASREDPLEFAGV